MQTITLGDSLSLLRGVGADTYDTVFADPPYGIGYRYSPGPTTVNASHATGTAIANDGAPFIWWLFDALRVTKPGGALLCFCAWTTQEDFRRAIELAGWKVRSQVIWDKAAFGLGDTKAQFAPNHEVIWFATKGKGFTFPGGRPGSVIRVPKLSKCENHPHEKPVALLSQLIGSVTPKVGRVLDPFAGSASAGVACRSLGLPYDGFEIDPKWYEVAARRLT
jgi:site-specific DNA-methyltransferase (adenine-specific)